MSVLDLDAVRAQFPALERRLGDRPVAYLDGPGGTQVPRSVVAAMTEYLFEHNANTNWRYPSSEETDAAIAGSRGAVADFVGSDASEIVFALNMTTATFHLSRAIGRRLSPGDEIVVTELDHHANVDTWRALSRERGAAVRTVAMRVSDGTLDFAQLERLVGPRTKVVAIGAASNALGTITDVARVAAVAKRVGAVVFCDAVHYAAHRLPDVRALGCDALACSAYKFYGPHLGFLWIRSELLEQLDPPKVAPASDHGPERLETGTQSHEAIVGTAAAIEFLAGLGAGTGRRERLEAAYSALAVHERELCRRLHHGLSAIAGVVVFGPSGDAARTPTVSFRVEGARSDAVAARLSCRHAIFVSHGDFYATTLVRRLGAADDGLVRVGCSIYTTVAEVERVLAAIEDAASAARRGELAP